MNDSKLNDVQQKMQEGITMFKFWGNGSQEAMDLVKTIRVRSTDNFNWTFIFILAVVFYVYWTENHKKNYVAVATAKHV